MYTINVGEYLLSCVVCIVCGYWCVSPRAGSVSHVEGGVSCMGRVPCPVFGVYVYMYIRPYNPVVCLISCIMWRCHILAYGWDVINEQQLILTVND